MCLEVTSLALTFIAAISGLIVFFILKNKMDWGDDDDDDDE